MVAILWVLLKIYASHCGIPFCGKIPSDWTQGIWADRKGLSYLSFHFWNKPIYLNSDRDCSGRSTQVHNGDYWLQKIDNPHSSVNPLNWFCLAYDYSYQIWIQYYFVFSSNEISKTLNAYVSKLVLWHLSTSSTTVFNLGLQGNFNFDVQ